MSQPVIDRDFARQRASVPKGLQLHFWLAAGCLVLLPGPTTVGEIAAGVLLALAVLRVPRTYFLWPWSLLQPVTIMAGAWVLWQVISLAWSPNPKQGLDEIGACRWMLALLVLWPIIEFRPKLIAALCIGFVLGNVAQFMQVAWHDAAWFPWKREPNRFPGWWDGALAGTVLTGVLGLHLPAAFMGAGRRRWLALGAAAVTLAGLLATGTRSGWIASAALIAVVLAVAAVKSRHRAPIFAGVAVLAGAATVGALLFRGPIERRLDDAREEVVAALQRDDFDSSTGARILMAEWALRAFRAHPLVGVGAGGYRTWVVEHQDQTRQNVDWTVQDHAHNAWLHIAATSGLVGLIIAIGFAGCALWGGFRRLTPESLGTYDAGPAFAMIGLLFISMFDSVHLNSQSAMLLGVLIALAPARVPHRVERVANA